MTEGAELQYVREVMGQGEVSLADMAHHLGVSTLELEEMEAGTRPVPEDFFDCSGALGATREASAGMAKSAYQGFDGGSGRDNGGVSGVAG